MTRMGGMAGGGLRFRSVLMKVYTDRARIFSQAERWLMLTRDRAVVVSDTPAYALQIRILIIH